MLTVAGRNSIKRSSMSLRAAEESMARLGSANSQMKRGGVWLGVRVDVAQSIRHGENVLEHVMCEHQINGLGPDRFLSTSVRAPFLQP
jgi:hypothetical protein